jgi:hypothetical protein
MSRSCRLVVARREAVPLFQVGCRNGNLVIGAVIIADADFITGTRNEWEFRPRLDAHASIPAPKSNWFRDRHDLRIPRWRGRGHGNVSDGFGVLSAESVGAFSGRPMP